MFRFAPLLLLWVADAVPLKCNPERYESEIRMVSEAAKMPPTSANLAPLHTATLTLLPQDKGDESPACLDGSPYGFYFQPSTTGSTKWTIFINGGGWCYGEPTLPAARRCAHPAS